MQQHTFLNTIAFVDCGKYYAGHSGNQDEIASEQNTQICETLICHAKEDLLAIEFC